jgi:8-oxo-dGTP diphosphatase
MRDKGVARILILMYCRHAVGFSGDSLSHAGRCIATRLTSSSFLMENVPIPRAAVSICVRCQDHYLLVQRGKAPNAGMWSFPGGKIEYAETTLEGARRELYEETKGWPILQWHPRAFDTTDSFGKGYHFVIAHCYAEVSLGTNDPLPRIAPADDAAAAMWFQRDKIQDLEKSNSATTGLCRVIDRAEALLDANLLETTVEQT